MKSYLDNPLEAFAALFEKPQKELAETFIENGFTPEEANIKAFQIIQYFLMSKIEEDEENAE